MTTETLLTAGDGAVDEMVLEEDVTTEPETIETGAIHRQIFTQSSDPTVKDLRDRYTEGDLDLDPKFQRHFVWDTVKSSRLIESALLDVPLPIVYLAEEEDGKESVIDGQQRLTSFIRFLDGQLTLTGLKVDTSLNGAKFAQLDKEMQRKVQRTTLRTITLLKQSDPDLKFEIFERLNTGSVALNDQELRNCVYRGNYNVLLQELAADPDFMWLMNLKKPEMRMRDVEFVLRFAAFMHATYLNYHPPMKTFLNSDMEGYRTISPGDAGELRKAFKNSVQLIRSLLGQNAFKRFYVGTEGNHNGTWEQKKFNASLYDVLMFGFTKYDKNQIQARLDLIREGLIDLMTTDRDFINAIELSTSSVKMVTARFDKWRAVLQAVVGAPEAQPRCFSRQLKDERFNRDATCQLCGQRIEDVDDSALDHKQQYWLGGETVPENAQLTHRYCNWSRPRIEV